MIEGENDQRVEHVSSFYFSSLPSEFINLIVFNKFPSFLCFSNWYLNPNNNQRFFFLSYLTKVSPFLSFSNWYLNLIQIFGYFRSLAFNSQFGVSVSLAIVVYVAHPPGVRHNSYIGWFEKVLKRVFQLQWWLIYLHNRHKQNLGSIIDHSYH